MPARLCNCVVLMTVLVAGTSGMLIPSFVQAKDPMPTFDLDHIIDLALERNPMIAGAQSVIAQSEGRRIEAGAYPNPTITVQTADATLRDPSLGRRMAERNLTEKKAHSAAAALREYRSMPAQAASARCRIRRTQISNWKSRRATS